MEAYSMDLRKRVVAACDQDSSRGARKRIAQRFGVSTEWIRRLLLRRRETGNYAPLNTKPGRKPLFAGRRLEQLERIIAQQPDVTLAELRERLEVDCSLTAIHNTLRRLGYRRKKRRFGPRSKIAPT